MVHGGQLQAKRVRDIVRECRPERGFGRRFVVRPLQPTIDELVPPSWEGIKSVADVTFVCKKGDACGEGGSYTPHAHTEHGEIC